MFGVLATISNYSAYSNATVLHIIWGMLFLKKIKMEWCTSLAYSSTSFVCCGYSIHTFGVMDLHSFPVDSISIDKKSY